VEAGTNGTPAGEEPDEEAPARRQLLPSVSAQLARFREALARLAAPRSAPAGEPLGEEASGDPTTVEPQNGRDASGGGGTHRGDATKRAGQASQAGGADASQPKAAEEAPADKRQVFKVDTRERLAGFAAAAVAAAAFCAIWIPKLHEHLVAAKGKPPPLDPSTSLLYGLLMAVAIGVCAVIGRRALLGFVILGVGLGGPWNTFILGQVAYLALAAWLLYHAYQTSNKIRQQAQAGRAASGGGARGSPSPAQEGRASGSGRQGRRRRSEPSGPPKPEASKRYTPPKPRRKKITPPAK
jgi:hypothetical protein